NWVTNDGLTFTIDLDPNAKWADGVSINASDIQYNYQLIIDPDYAHPDVTYWSSYINENTVTIIDEFTVNMTFTQPYIFQEGNLALDLLPKHIWESVPPKKPFITSC
ncbi:MAG: ABC transporter substrate-binding protein, partial [Asgard group archaeon]|nr:ABC transporter substrate-binding protein [Asgard group archaeon]